MAIAFQPEPEKKKGVNRKVSAHSSESDHYSQVRCVITFEMGTGNGGIGNSVPSINLNAFMTLRELSSIRYSTTVPMC